MSGFAGAIALDVGFALAGIAFPGFGTVAVGGVAVFGLETPERMPFGGSQKVAVHRLLGGDRVIDILGPDEADISFSGLFSGPEAQGRALLFDQLRQAGQVVPLIWPGDGRNVIITDFKCSYERGGFLMPYSITCLVLPQPQQQPPPSLNSQMNNDASYGIGAGQAAQTGAQTSPVPGISPT